MNKLIEISCPHCQKKLKVTKQMRRAVFQTIASKPRPSTRGPERAEICRKAAAASHQKRWGHVHGTPTKLEVKAAETAKRRHDAMISSLSTPVDENNSMQQTQAGAAETASTENSSLTQR